jgi:hypothetical protein
MIVIAKEIIMASVSRKVKREIERRFKKLVLKRKNKYVATSDFEKTFAQDGWKDEKRNWRGDIDLAWIHANLKHFWTGVRQYQRFKLKDTHWKQTIVQDILSSGFRVLELTIRVRSVTNDIGGTFFELEVIDGQQRITAFIDFMHDKFTINVGSKDMKYSEMETQASGLYRIFNELDFGAIYYENITDEEASIIFKKVNDQTDINCQEDRNALHGPYSTYIADKTYYGSDEDPLDDLFERGIKKNKQGVKKEVLVNFPKLNINGRRMEQCEWFSHLIHWDMSDLRSTTNQDTHTFWQMDLNPYLPVWENRKRSENLLKLANKIMTAASPDQKENDITPMILQFMILWYKELTTNSELGDYWNIVVDDFVNGFLSCLDDYSWNSELDRKRGEANKRCRSKGKDDNPWTMFNSSDDMQKMKDLFGGHNLRAINTVLQVLEHELKINPEQFGAVQLDSKRNFEKAMIIQKWKEQGKCDAKTGEPLDIKNIVGDHIIPHSKGIKAGGTTTWDNLRVVSQNRNSKMGNSGEKFKIAA